MRILDQLPLLAAAKTVHFGQHQATLHRNSLLVWISIGLHGEDDPLRISPPFPALLDSGNHSESFLHENHLFEWAGIHAALLPIRRHKNINDERIPFRDADVWIHSNIPGTSERCVDKPPYPLRLVDGLAVRP